MDEELLSKRLDALIFGRDDFERFEDAHQSKIPYEVAFESERFLAAWLLLSRLSQDQLEKAWKKHESSLSKFATRLLRFGHTNGDATDDRTKICYIRLISQVSSRLESITTQSLIAQSIRKTWISIQHDLNIYGSSRCKLNIDVLAFFFVVLAQSDDKEHALLFLNDTWDVYLKFHRESVDEAALQTYSTDQPERIVLSRPKGGEEQAMTEFLEACLDDVSDAEASSVDYSIKAWERLVLGFFEVHEMIVSEVLASKILKWIASSQQTANQSHDLRFGWHEWLMRYTVNNWSTKRNASLLLESDAMKCMQRLLLAHVVSPTEQNLRSAAWHTISVIFQAYGWRWCREKGPGSEICIWARLASGEWKLQLETVLESSGGNETILEGCGQLLMIIVQLLLTINERPDQPLPLDSSGLLHLKESLDNAFAVTTDFMLKQTTYPPVVVQLWCLILPELQFGVATSKESTIKVIAKLLECTDDDTLVRPLLHIQNSSEDCVFGPLEATVEQYLERNVFT